MTKIGVFDSGVGGQAVATRIQQLFPHVEVLSVSDSTNMPYGLKRRAEIIRLTLHAVQPLIDAECDAIVVACNTATTNAIDELRAAHPLVHFVGIEPMIKPAARLTKTGTIAVLATPSTLQSHAYHRLKHRWAPQLNIIEPDCSTWAGMIEDGHDDRIALHSVMDELRRWDVDVIVLGCTHYHWIKDRIQGAAGPRVHVLEPSDAIGARLDSLLSINAELPQ